MRDETAREELHRRTQLEECESRLLSTVESLAADQSLADFQTEERAPWAEAAAASTGNYDFTGLATVRTAFGLTGVGQTVAVIDSGIAYDHPALGGGWGASYRVVGGWDFTEENDANPYDDRPGGAHGTHVAGIIGSTDARNPGVAPGVDLVALRVFNDSGSGNFTWIEKALQWVHANRYAFENPITAVNLSIGATWNATNVPNWTTLEDEFAQLKADGIFIAVAAGNAFTTYNTVGLSYPAASPHVVPVASVDGDGSISSFSQRQERVIAAPGRSIRSTVPDYLGNLNRKTDDFSTMSGTSMAAPYVAGASVLIRQAMQIAGMTNIQQDSIYAVMRDTADSVYDAITAQSFARLNVEHAIESILGADDFGSSVDTAHDLGTVGQTTLSGMIGRLDDQDFFTFTAARSGTVRANVTSDGRLNTTWQSANLDGATIAGDTLSFAVVAGQQYTIGLAGSQSLGKYAIEVAITAIATNWQFTLSGDVTGDSRADIIRRDAATGQWSIERSDGAQQVIGHWSQTNSYTDVQLADVNGDGRLDIVGRDSFGDWWATTNRSGKFTNQFLGHFNSAILWQDVMLGDLDGDHAADIVARDAASGNWIAIRSTLGRSAQTIANWNPANSYQSVNLIDITGDGRADLVGRDNFGDWWTSTHSGSRFQNRFVARWNTTADWQDVRTGDLNGDGRTDLLGRDTSTGNWCVISFDGTRFANRQFATWSPLELYSQVSLTDVDADGRLDVIGRDSTGLWLASSVSGTTVRTGVFPTSLAPAGRSSSNAVTADTLATPAHISLADARRQAIDILPVLLQSTTTEPIQVAHAPCDDVFDQADASELARALTVAEPLLAAVPRVALTENDVARLVELSVELSDDAMLVDLLDEAILADDPRAYL